MVDGEGGRGRRCVHGADGRMSADEAVGRTSGRADRRTGQKGRGRLGGRRPKGCGQSSGRADGRTGPRKRGHADGRKRRRRGPTRADGRMGGQVVERTGGLGDWRRKSHGWADWADGRTRADRRTSSPSVGRTGGQADGRTSGWAWV